ncbi:dienelactone hydrolase family protein [Alteromonas sp. NFXS44]|uniref:dienelactone hydrolase family protein n=1 Tax=Alteromonas sp. NFXS44 TaxID=2818435 RepID=UPI0032DFA182
MCDNHTESDIHDFKKNGGQLNRRDFSKLVGLGALSSAFPQFAMASGEVQTQQVMVNTPDGVADCLLASPKSGKHPAVVMWPDIMGRRASYDLMGQRLAAAGYAVLVVNPFYRDVKGAALPDGISFPAPEAREILGPMRAKLTPDNTNSDNRAFFDFLNEQSVVDASAPKGVLGYCMSGTFTMYAAAAFPEEVGAIATFHGGGLATKEDDSPHFTVAASKALALHAIAENDAQRSPEMEPLLVEAYKEADLQADIAVYPGTLHGWTPPDSKVYNEEQADAAWNRMLKILDKGLHA